MPLTACLQPLLAEAAARQIRLPVLLQGQQAELLLQCQQLIATVKPQSLYWLGEQAPAASTQLKPGNNYQLLGSECDMLVVNAFSGFNADLVAASAGCLKAGGVWLLLAPSDEHWCQQPNPAHSALLPYPLDPQQHQGQFIRFWLSRLAESKLLKLTLNNNQLTINRTLTLPEYQSPATVAPPYASAEQQQAVAAILKVVSGHRKRPLVLVADRGRGKSAALGLAAALLVQQGKKHLIITAASPNAAATAINHYQQQLSDTPGLRFIAVDQLLLEQPELDLLLIDEAAALPTTVLKQLADRYSRIVFATTEHGYEGTGRGFQLRFQRYLEQTQSGWKRLQIKQPVRYQQHDPLEQLIFNSFLLQQPEIEPVYQPGQPMQLRQHQHKDWLAAPEQLSAVFHLLSLAHYQTQVKDLVALLDNPQLSVIALYQQDQLLACALLSYEGELAPELCQQIYQGKRRVQGHLLAQSLAFHLAEPQLASQRLVRVMRVAVAQPLQRQGLGSHLLTELNNLLQQQNIDWLGTSFGVSPALLAFWQAAGYIPVRLSHFADNASSEPSVLMLKPINGSKELVQQLNQQLANELYHCLQEYPANLSFDVIRKLVRPPTVTLTAADIEQLQLFAEGKRPYQLVAHQLLNWFNFHYLQLEPFAASVIAARLWQKQSWQTISQRFQLAGKAACIKVIQQQISRC
ncbi:tRNA(Met)-cytidine N(4)-acetyltransferase [Arsukibacterium tuosuense]|uniref:tRNA(Met) cytidine acetyltransferase TmcA n=1 Tax=Arsukibacterium tuosuense TaxID=1323745 RepID=A0A285JKF7_9GAMM|nr:GNAT family N-acetyltransferase [Arsukibacterium tuosuense]SNY59826.1 tRNA(Met)-cytidine N(4)-acetyltransferase [Arsukibacterium tuosuense]